MQYPTTQDMQPLRLEDVDESSLQCLLRTVHSGRGNCTFDKIGDLFQDVGVLVSSDALDDNSTNIIHISNKIRSTDMSSSNFAQQKPACLSLVETIFQRRRSKGKTLFFFELIQ